MVICCSTVVCFNGHVRGVLHKGSFSREELSLELRRALESGRRR